jgi:hypothetical protein
MADAMVSFIAHEYVEAITNPDNGGWYRDSDHKENADICAWRFSGSYTSPITDAPSSCNMQTNGRHFYVQDNWVNAGGGYCDSAYPPAQ